MSEKEIAVNAGKMKWLEEFDIKIKENAFVTPSSHLNYKELVKFIDEHIRQALESQMSDLRKEVEKMERGRKDYENSHDMIVNSDHDYGYNKALNEVLLLMKRKESLQNCIECGEVVEENESVKNCHGVCRIKIS